MKPSSNNTLLALLVAAVLPGTFASSPLGGTPRHSRLRSPGTSSVQQHNTTLFGYEALEHMQPSNATSQAIGTNGDKQVEGSDRLQAMGISLMLMGGIAFQMALFYLVNFPHPGVVLTTWRVLSTSSSIFISALMYHMISTQFVSDGNRTQVPLVVFAACYLVSSLFARLRFPRLSPETCQALATMSGHLASFAAMSVCMELQNVTLFRGAIPQTGTRMIALTGLTAVLLTFLALCVNQVKPLQGPELDERDSEPCEEIHDGIFTLSVGFLLVAIARFYICGNVQDYGHHANFSSVTQAHANHLLIWGVAFGVAACLGSCILHRLGSRVVSLMLQLFCLTFAWSILFWGEWQLKLWGWEGPIAGGYLLAAFSLTVFSFFAIFAVSWVAKHMSHPMVRQYMNSFELALGLLVGLSWATSLAKAMEDVSVGAHIETPSIDPRVFTYIIAALLLVFGVPAWRYFILPRAMQLETVHNMEEETLEKSLKAAAGRAAKFHYGTLNGQRAAFGWQFSSPRPFSELDVVIL